MFKYLSIFSSGGHLVYQSGTLFSYFGREPPRQYSYEVWITLARRFRKSLLLKQIIHDFLFYALAAILFLEAKPF